MPVSQSVLGMNARNFLYIGKYNPRWAKVIADDKLETKKVLINNDIPTPVLLGSVLNREEIQSFDWSHLPERGFVVKPARGYGGEGIIPIKSWDGESGVSTSGETYTKKQLEAHFIDILEGAYSLQHLPDKAFLEERLILHPFFRKIVQIGIPDIRIIVLNHIPVMAMMRIPTPESEGKANLHQGAVALGIDMRTGITTTAISRDKLVSRVPGTKIKTRGIKIPQWNDLLLLASKTQGASGLGYIGVDVVMDSRYGPMILEINARPGLSIQNANRASLRNRLERIEHLPAPTPKRGVEVSQSLFAEAFSEKVMTTPHVLGVIEDVAIKTKDGPVVIQAKVDSGALRSSIDEKLAQDLGLEEGPGKLLIRSANGERVRDTVKISYELAGRKVNSVATVTDRSQMAYPMIIGRIDMAGFLIDPARGGAKYDDLNKHEEKVETLNKAS